MLFTAWENCVASACENSCICASFTLNARELAGLPVCLTLPKLPFPKTCKKLKSSRPTLTVSSSGSSNVGCTLLTEFWPFIPVMWRELCEKNADMQVNTNVEKYLKKKKKSAFNKTKYSLIKEAFWDSSWQFSYITWDFFLESVLSTPISDNLLASSARFTPQLSATFCSQRLWMFILQPGWIHTTQMITTILPLLYFNVFKLSKYVLTLALETLFYQAVK